jgi:TRAP-type C4-dicarboxylate transport system permease large subunit
MIFIIIIGAMIFGYFLSVTRLPFTLANFVCGLPVSRYFILAAILLLYIILGALMDEMAMVLLTVPVFFPVMMQLGFDPIWFGIIIIMMCVLGMIAPPVGMIVFVIAGIAPDIPMSTIYRGILPFFLAAILLVVLLVAFPQIVLFLPSLM